MVPFRGPYPPLSYPLRGPYGSCGLRKHRDGPQCEMNKFDRMLECVASTDQNFAQVIALDQVRVFLFARE